jgi:hypothetical protein
MACEEHRSCMERVRTRHCCAPRRLLSTPWCPISLSVQQQLGGAGRGRPKIFDPDDPDLILSRPPGMRSTKAHRRCLSRPAARGASVSLLRDAPLRVRHKSPWRPLTAAFRTR